MKKSKAENQKQKIFQNVSKNMNTQKGKKKKKKKHTFLKTILVLILLTIVAFTGLFIYRMNKNGWTFGGLVATILGHDENTLANLSRINILVVGQSQNLTDTILVCSYDPKIQEVSMLSIPRDTFTGSNKLYADPSDKINAIYYLNPELLRKKVENITGLEIPYCIKVDTDGFKELVDSIGGIDFEVPIDMDYDDSSQNLYIHLKAGYQHLNGSQAEQVVRFRHNNNGTTYPLEYGQEDLGRMKTQRAFITEVIKQLAQPKNITKVDEYIKIANRHISTNFDLWSLKDYAPYAIDFKTENIKTATLPGVPEKCNEYWFYVYNKKETEKVVSELFKKPLTAEQQQNSKIKVNILNGTKDQVKLTNLKNILKENGYTVVSTGETSATPKTTIINRTGQSDEVCNALKDIIGVGLMSNTNSNDKEKDFTIIIGSDY